MITYFVHSTSTDNEQGVQSGWNDPSLSDLGKEQAHRLQQKLITKSFDRIYCSDLTRAKETAQIAFSNTQVIFDPNLREMNYGDLNGVASDKFPADKLSCIDQRFLNGENCVDVESRVRSFLKGIDARNQKIAIVAHKYPQLALEVICKEISWKEAIENDWREKGGWRSGWFYQIPEDL